MNYKTVYLMMGEKCNFNCAYCLQHDQNLEQCTSKVDEKIFDYFNSMPEKSIRFVFWGGEPLLYFETIKQFVEKLDSSKFRFGIVSNGDLLILEMVDYINENNISITFSNDGMETDKFRTKNILDDLNFVRLMKKINGMNSIASVISAKNYDVENIWLYATHILGSVYVNYDYIMDTGSTPRDLTDFDFDKFNSYMDELFSRLKDKISRNSLEYNEAVYLNSLVKPLKDFIPGNTPCGTATSTLNIDCMGNVFLCHNSGVKLGNILTQSKDEILKEFSKYNIYSNSDECRNCEANVYCHGGCILVGDEARKRYYCKMKKSIYSHIKDILDFMEEKGI